MMGRADEISTDVTVPQYVDVAGSKVRIVAREHEADSGRPVLLINGLGARLEMWRPFATSLQGRGLLMFDLPGITGASARDLPLTMSGLATWITQVMDVRGLDKVDVVGYSWGGALAQQLARIAPRRIRGLILASTNFGFGAMPSPQVLPLLSLMASESADDPWQLFNAAIGGTVVDRDPFRAIFNAVTPSTTPLEGYWRQLIALAGWTSIHWLHELNIATLVVAGDDDPYISTATTRTLAKSIPGARLELIQGSGHLLPLNEPTTMARAVENFLRSIDTGN